MPLKMRSLFKQKNKKNTINHDNVTTVKSFNNSGGYGDDRSTPPIDPDGSTASNDSNGNYLSSSKNSQQQQQQLQDAIDAQDAAMTASEFRNSSDEVLHQKRLTQPPNSPFASKLNLRSHRDCRTKSREGVPIITAGGSDYFSPSAVRSSGNYATEGFYSKSKQVFGGKSRPKERPSARSSAFGGAPRYDWMDIETTAAIKIQATYRRVQTQNYLDANNLSTPGMRNRRARLQARYHSRSGKGRGNHISADVPFPFSLCGVGLLFGDGTFEDEAIVDSLEKKKKQKKKVAEVREDEEKRRFRMRKKESQHLEEGIEVVESFDADASLEEELGQGGGRSRNNKTSKRSSRRSKSKGRSSRSKSQNGFDQNEEEGVFL